MERDELEGATTPEPPSVAVHAKETSSACQVVSGNGQLTEGALRSTLLPAMLAGEAAQLLTASQAWAPPAEAAALAVSNPAPTEVVRLTSWVAGPDPPSV